MTNRFRHSSNTGCLKLTAPNAQTYILLLICPSRITARCLLSLTPDSDCVLRDGMGQPLIFRVQAPASGFCWLANEHRTIHKISSAGSENPRLSQAGRQAEGFRQVGLAWHALYKENCLAKTYSKPVTHQSSRICSCQTNITRHGQKAALGPDTLIQTII